MGEIWHSVCYESDVFKPRREFITALVKSNVSSCTRVCLLPTGAEAYVSGIAELIFKVLFWRWRALFF